MTQKERMLAGLPYKAWLDGLSEERMACRRKLHAFNLLPPDEEAQAQRLLSGLQSCTAGHRNTYCYSVDAQWAQEAHHLSLSCGKYRAFLEVQALYPDITPEEIQGMTMREIRTLLSGAGEEGQAASPPGHGGHGHHGAGHGWGAAN